MNPRLSNDVPPRRRENSIPAPVSWMARRGRALSIAGIIVLAIGVLASSASAAEVHVLSGSLGAGELALSEHSGVAINQETGEVYVADTGNSRVAKFTSLGAADGSLATIAAPTFIAVDNSGGPSNGDLYVVSASDDSITKLDPIGTPVPTWGTAGRLEGLGEIAGITVDHAGNLWVYNTEANMREYDPSGAQTTQWSSGRGVAPVGIAIDTAENLYVVAGLGAAKFSATGEQLQEIFGPSGSVTSVAVDGSDDNVYLGQTSELLRLASTGQLVQGIGHEEGNLEGVSGIVVRTGGGDVFAANAGGDVVDVFSIENVEAPIVEVSPPTAVTGTSAHLTGEVNPNGHPTTCNFQLVNDEQFSKGGFEGSSAVPCAASPGSGSSLVPVEADAEGLLPGTRYHARLVATNVGGSAPSPEPNPTFDSDAVAPTVSAQTVIGVKTSEATLGATLISGGATTTFHFDFLSEAAFLAEGFTSPAARSTAELGPLPGDNSPHEVSATVTGLEANTRYVFRVVASNAVAAVSGSPVGFRTQSPSSPLVGGCPNELFRSGFSAALPDCRAYEQVTPVDKGGLFIEGFADLIAASSDGSSVTYISGAGSGFPAGGGGRQDTTTFLSSRAEDGGSWGTQRLLPPESLGVNAGFLGASRNMRFALVEAGANSGTALFFSDTAAHSITQITPYQTERQFSKEAFGYDAISPDGSRAFFDSKAKLTPDASAGNDNVYMWNRSSNVLTLVGILPDGEGGGAPEGGSFAGAYAWYAESTGRGGSLADLYVEAVNAASPDGDQIYFTAGGTGQLYLRRGLTGPNPQTVKVSKPNEGVQDPWVEEIGEELPAAFQEATPDGSRAFFISSQKLTGDASTGEFDEGKDLYRYDRKVGSLVDITGGQESAENFNGAEVKGLLGTSSDGSSGYFAAKAVLAPGGTIGSNNIYRFEEAQGTGEFSLTFVAKVREGSGCAGGALNWSPSSYCAPGISEYFGKASRVSADGRTLVFTTGGDIYIYGVASGQATCISCSPTGAASAGPAQLTAGFVNANQFVIPSTLPAAHLTNNLTNGGTRVFFQTPNSLVAEDTNGPPNCRYLIEDPLQSPPRQRPNCVDVYEWEAPNSPGGSCTRVEVNGGCLYLLSTGKSDQAAYFLDSSSEGSSAFIATTSQLVPVDKDDLYDVYDVRTDGGIVSQYTVPGVPCDGESCKGPGTSPPSLTTPGTSSFYGPGNERPHRHKKKHHKKKHHKKKHHKKKHHKKKHKSNGRNHGGSNNGGNK